MTEQYVKYWELFIKKKADVISQQELSQLNEWIKTHKDSKSIISEFEEIYKASSGTNNIPAFNAGDDWENLQTMIKVNAESKAASTIKIFPWIARVAAAVILVLGFTFIYYQYQKMPSQELILQTMVRTDDSGQQLVDLPDGSRAWLNKNSELLYPDVFSGDTRTLYLKGEAFFEVAPDKGKPFIVHSGSSKTKVLGTSFNLRAYSKEDEVKLTVVTGKVAFTLADDKEGVIVTPGDIAVLVNDTKQITHDKNEDFNFLSWKTGQLKFDDSPMDQLITALERHYDISIEIEQSETLKCRFTGDFHDIDIEDAIKVITKATGTSYTLNEQSYIIQGLGCN